MYNKWNQTDISKTGCSKTVENTVKFDCKNDLR